MTTQHTPGPWRVDADTNVRSTARGYDKVATVLPATTFAECQANARLISAAPDLLAALCEAADAMGRFAVQYAHRMSENEAREMTCASHAARAAIAKATQE